MSTIETTDTQDKRQRPVRDADAEAGTRRSGYRRGFEALQQLLPTHDSQSQARSRATNHEV